MKTESIKSILRAYLKERQLSSTYDDIDGCDYPEYMSGEPFDCWEDRPNDLSFVQQQSPALPLDELNVPLPPEEERLAIEFGRQLSQMSDEFESDHTDAVRKKPSENENRSVKFKKHSIHVPPTSDRVQIPITQTKASNSVVNATWRTCDKSAKAGLHYVESQGTISFVPGDSEKSIEVEIIKENVRKADINFVVELYDAEGTYNTLWIYIFDDSKFYPEEKQVVENLFNCRRDVSVSEVLTRLSDNVTHNTFKAALQCLSSSADSIPKELALASELLRLTIPYARFSLLTNVFCDYFSDLPELEDLASMF